LLFFFSKPVRGPIEKNARCRLPLGHFGPQSESGTVTVVMWAGGSTRIREEANGDCRSTWNTRNASSTLTLGCSRRGSRRPRLAAPGLGHSRKNAIIRQAAPQFGAWRRAASAHGFAPAAAQTFFSNSGAGTGLSVALRHKNHDENFHFLPVGGGGARPRLRGSLFRRFTRTISRPM